MLSFIILFISCIFGGQQLLCQKSFCSSGNCYQGYGDYQWANGQRYLGNFEAGKMHGLGIFYWSRTYKYVGQWKAGKRNGRGVLYYPHGAVLKGTWKNNQLIQIERNTTILNKSDIRYGHLELTKIAKDRPQILEIVQPNDSIWHWVALQLAGKEIGSRIYWQSQEGPRFKIPLGVNAVHAYPSDRQEAKIWVANSKHPEKLWSGLIFELFNIRNASEFERIENDVINGRCSKAAYIRQFARLEYKAGQSLAKFYQTVWLPFCESKGIKTDPQKWFCYLPDNFDAWMRGFTNLEAYPWYPYAGYYDKIVRSVIEKY